MSTDDGSSVPLSKVTVKPLLAYSLKRRFTVYSPVAGISTVIPDKVLSTKFACDVYVAAKSASSPNGFPNAS